MLIEHHPGHLNKGLILAFNNTILLRHTCRGKLVLGSQRGVKGLKMSIFEFCAIVIMNRSHGIFGKLILQPKNETSSMSKSLILLLHEEYPRIARKSSTTISTYNIPPKEQTRAGPIMSI
jgi:hypothetical protein